MFHITGKNSHMNEKQYTTDFQTISSGKNPSQGIGRLSAIEERKYLPRVLYSGTKGQTIWFHSKFLLTIQPNVVWMPRLNCFRFCRIKANNNATRIQALLGTLICHTERFITSCLQCSDSLSVWKFKYQRIFCHPLFVQFHFWFMLVPSVHYLVPIIPTQ